MEVKRLNNLTIDKQVRIGQLSGAAGKDRKVSFGGVSNISLNTMDFIARGGLCASFCIQDGLGMILPRIVQGFYRNKDITGEYNYGEAAEVAIREILTGPPMFLIPIAMLSAGRKFLGKACDVPVEFIKGFGNVLKSTFKNNGFDESKFVKSFYKQAVENALKNSTSKGWKPEELARETDAFVDAIFDVERRKPRTLLQKMFNKKIEESSDHKLDVLRNKFISLRKKYSTNTSEIYSNVTMNSGGQEFTCSFDNFLSHLRNFAQDAAEYTKKSGLDEEAINKFISKRTRLRKGMIVAMFLGVMGFCNKIPDLYKLHEVNPGLKGLNQDKDNKFYLAGEPIRIGAFGEDNNGVKMQSPFKDQNDEKFWLPQKEVHS